MRRNNQFLISINSSREDRRVSVKSIELKDMITTVAPELDAIFRQCGYSHARLNEFLDLLDKYPLGLDWASLWRQVRFPTQPGYPDLEPFIYYYVPNSG